MIPGHDYLQSGIEVSAQEITPWLKWSFQINPVARIN
jgi:hypothetical protein